MMAKLRTKVRRSFSLSNGERTGSGEMRRKLFENADGRGLIVNEDARFSRGNLAAEDQVLVVRVSINAIVFEDLGDQLFRSALHLEYSRDHGPVGAEAYDVG